MARNDFDEFDDDDPYRRRIEAGLDAPTGPPRDPADLQARAEQGGVTGQGGPSSGGFDRTRFRDAWMSQGGDPGGFVGGHQGDFGAGVQFVPGSKDKVRLPTGEVMDLSINADPTGRGTATGWTGMGQQDQAGGAIRPYALAPGGYGTPAGGGPTDASGGSSFQNRIRQTLLSQMQGLQKPVSAGDPAISAQSQAYRTARERGAQQERAQAAERAAFTGLNLGGQGSGGFETTLQGIREGAGEDIAANEAGLVGREVEQRRATLQSLLNMALQSGDAESARELQMAIAQMNQQLGQAQLGQRQYEYDDTRGYQIGRDAEEDAYRDAVMALLGGA